MELSDETFEKPDNFDIDEYFGSSFGIYKGEPTTEVTLRFSAEKSKWIKDQIWHKDQKAATLKDGSLELSFPVADFSEIKMEILKHGDQVVGDNRNGDKNSTDGSLQIGLRMHLYQEGNGCKE